QRLQEKIAFQNHGRSFRHGKVRTLLASECADKVFNGLDHRATEIKAVGDGGGVSNRLPHAQTGGATVSESRIATTKQVIGAVLVPRDVNRCMFATMRIFRDEDSALSSCRARFIDRP